MIERKIWLFVCSVLWVQVSSKPQNCNPISRSSVEYKYPYQQTKTILYQLPYQQSVTGSSTKPSQLVFDSNHASTIQPLQQPLIQHNPIQSNVYSQNQNKEQTIEYQHTPTLNNLNQQFQTLQQPEYKDQEFNFDQGYLNFLPASSTPQQYFAPQQNQYTYSSLPTRAESTHRPIINPYQLPQIVPHKHYNEIEHQPTNQVPQNSHIYSPHVKATPLVFNQVYHPIFPQTHNLLKTTPLTRQQTPLLQHPTPHLQQKTPPTYYTNFHPMIPVAAPVEVQHNDAPPQKEEDREEEREEVTEEDHENNEEGPDSEDTSYKKDYNFDENFFKNSKYSFPQPNNEEEDEGREKGAYEVQDHEDQEEDNDDHEESVNSYVLANPYSKVTSKHRPEKYIPKPYRQFKPSKEVKTPKTEVKMFHYTKSLNIPQKEFIESKGSESVPVIQKSKQTFRENWYITKSTRDK